MNRLSMMVAVILGFVAQTARSEVQALYWMIDDNNQYEFDYACLYAVKTEDLALNGHDWLVKDGYGPVDSIALPVGVPDGYPYAPPDGSLTTTMINATALELENLSAYTFYIELLQWDEATESEIRSGASYVATYDDLMTHGHIGPMGLDVPLNLVVWKPTTIPEPTTGLLVLLGGVLLLLRRREPHRA